MKIAFATTQTVRGSTVIGRVLPLTHELAKKYEMHVLVLGKLAKMSGIKFHSVGQEPFHRYQGNKKRLAGLMLVFNMSITAIRTFWVLFKLKPEVVIIVKNLPANVLGVGMWRLFNRNKKVVLDVDDFELVANQLSSIWQRLSILWAERAGVKIADAIVCASPFLADHFIALKPSYAPLIIPTGLSIPKLMPDKKRQQARKLIITYIGSVSIASGHRVDMLPEILKGVRSEVPQALLYIIGSGDDMALLKKKFANMGLIEFVRFYDRFNLNKLPIEFNDTSVLIDPADGSLIQRAKSSFRVNLALALGLPIVTSSIGVRTDMVPRKLHSRLFARPGDAEDYIRVILGINNYPLTRDDVDMMIKKSSSYTWDKLSKIYETTFIV